MTLKQALSELAELRAQLVQANEKIEHQSLLIRDMRKVLVYNTLRVEMLEEWASKRSFANPFALRMPPVIAPHIEKYRQDKQTQREQHPNSPPKEMNSLQRLQLFVHRNEVQFINYLRESNGSQFELDHVKKLQEEAFALPLYFLEPEGAPPPPLVPEEENVCPICLEEMGQDVPKLRCKHKFHGHCISTWLALDNSCPNCRCPYPEQSTSAQ